MCRTRHECPALRAVIEGYASSSGGHDGYGSWVNTDYRTRARYSFKQFMVPIWWQSNEIESSYRVYKAIVGHFSNVLAAILDMDKGKILIIELVRDIP